MIIWTKQSAEEYLKEIATTLDRAGFDAKIVGSVATKGQSDHDLDILLTPKPKREAADNFDFEIIMQDIAGDWTYAYECYEAVSQGRIIDFFVKVE